jgi:4-amino-4-deoxy-L-arabinose transferase-like glycosyltransferase
MVESDKLSAGEQTLVRGADGRRMLGIALAIGLIVRAVIIWQTPALGTEIVDEQHYAALARNVLAGHGIAWGPGEPTSIRPPLYPAFLAAIWGLVGIDLQAVRLVQFVLALLTTGLVYQIGRRMFSPVVGRYAAAFTWLYPSLIFFNFTILTETLYVFLLTGFLLLAVMLVTEPRAATAVGCGLALGLACLTRSALWPLPLVLCPLLAVLLRRPLRTRLALAAAVFVGYGLVVGPWALRNTRLQGVVTIVDTMGGLNLHMGNYEHTPEERLWDAVALKGDKHWAYPLRSQNPPPQTEGQKDKWAQRRALEFIAANPLVSLRRAAIKFADFWGLERELAGGFSQGLYVAPRWFAILAPTLIAVTYAIVALAGATGFWLVRARDWRTEVLLLLPVVGITAVHTIVFGHSRYHIPLVPILALYGAALVQHLAVRDAGLIPRVTPAGLRRLQIAGAAASVAVLVVIWSRQLLLVDADRIRTFLAHVR